MLGRFSNAVALSGMSPTPIPLGPPHRVAVRDDIRRLGDAVDRGRVAVNIRFFQRAGVEPTTAVAIGALDGFTGFLCQMFLMGTILLFGLGSLNITLSEDFDVETAKTLILWLLVILVIAIIVIFAVAKIRNWLFGLVRKVRDFVVPLLQSPRRSDRRVQRQSRSPN